MKVKNLLEDLNKCLKEYDDFLEWDVALEQHPNYKDCPNCNKPEDSLMIEHFDFKTLFIKSHAGICVGIECTKEKVYAINIHY